MQPPVDTVSLSNLSSAFQTRWQNWLTEQARHLPGVSAEEARHAFWFDLLANNLSESHRLSHATDAGYRQLFLREPRLLPHEADFQVTPLMVGRLYEAWQTHDKGRGVYYTPMELADYLVSRTLGADLSAALERIRQSAAVQDWDAARQTLTWVLGLRILDPACGCGVFLLAALAHLHAFYLQVQELDVAPGWLAVPRHGARYAVTEQLYGVDIDGVAVGLAEWALHRQACELDGESFSLFPAASNLGVGNALGGSPEATGMPNPLRFEAKARQLAGLLKAERGTPQPELDFTWAKAFLEVTAWHYVFGNPPYKSEVRKQAGLFRQLRAQPGMTTAYTAKMDLCDAFLSGSVDWLTPGGRLALVLPEYWTQRTAARLVRERLWRQGRIEEMWTFGEHKLFERAPGHHTSLLLWRKHTGAAGPLSVYDCLFGVGTADGPAAGRLISARVTLTAGSSVIQVVDRSASRLLEKLSAHPERLRATDIQQGIVFPQSRLRSRDWQRLPETVRQTVPSDVGIFVLTATEVEALALSAEEAALLRPYYPGSFAPFAGFPNGGAEAPPFYVLYLTTDLAWRMNRNPGFLPRIRRHLDCFAAINTSSHAPYGLHRARQPEWFEVSVKILGQRQVMRPAFAVVAQPAYVNEGFYILRPHPSLNPQALVGVLNSALGHFWFYHQKRKGHRLQIDKEVLLTFPLANPALPGWSFVAEIATALAPSPLDSTLLAALDEAVFDLYVLNAEERRGILEFLHPLPG